MFCNTLNFSLARPEVPQPVDPCSPSPCGQNAVCRTRNGAAACTCIPEYFGDPYVACRPECTTNAECPSTKACQNLHCIDPCPAAQCGVNAQCSVVNHIPNCVCNRGYIGDPFSACRLPPKRKFFIAFSFYKQKRPPFGKKMFFLTITFIILEFSK